jgi:hypothetical protein
MAVVGAGLFLSQVTACSGQAAPEKKPVAIPMLTKAPAGAIVLFGGKESDITNNWIERYTTSPAGWTVDANGVATPNKHDIVSKESFGDCFLHVEFREPADANGNAQGNGNSGVGFEGRYEVQILNSYGQQPGPENCGAFYSEKSPLVIASKKPGEWQTYDIIFRAPRFDADGKKVENARATVFQNGIIVQNNEEFPNPTGIQYGELKGEVKTAPLILQGDHDPVSFRNVWIVPIP